MMEQLYYLRSGNTTENHFYVSSSITHVNGMYITYDKSKAIKFKKKFAELVTDLAMQFLVLEECEDSKYTGSIIDDRNPFKY